MLALGPVQRSTCLPSLPSRPQSGCGPQCRCRGQRRSGCQLRPPQVLIAGSARGMMRAATIAWVAGQWLALDGRVAVDVCAALS